MRYLDIITEATIPPTEYGYWISTYSEIYPVGDHGHEMFIKAVEGCNSGEAIMDGWIRVVVGRTVLQAEACFSAVKPRVKAKLVQIAVNGEYTSFIVDNYDANGDYTMKQFVTVHEFMRGIDTMMER